MARRLILPGEAQRPAGGLQIIVPGRYADKVAQGERLGRCLVCGAEFFQGQEAAWQRHVGECARENLDELMANNPSRKLPFLDEANWDPEVECHMRRVVRPAMEREGRVTVRPSERAGF